GVARDMGFIGVEMQGRAEISLATMKKARLIDIKKLPQLIKADAYFPFVYAMRYSERPWTAAFKIRKHEDYQMDPAIADRVHFTRVISPRGKVLSQIRLWIRNSRKQYSAVTLPGGAKVLNAWLDGNRINPSKGDKGEILVPLKRQSATPFIVDVVFEDAEVPLSKTGGRIRLAHPGLDLPVSIAVSDIYIPETMHAFEPGGDFHRIQGVD
ncbi:MAG: hypothetical protein GY859_23265, partial [Desulfobacterales bacterium]|nr:hypothetical protein [Desulfobacterales bacterium]